MTSLQRIIVIVFALHLFVKVANISLGPISGFPTVIYQKVYIVIKQCSKKNNEKLSINSADAQNECNWTVKTKKDPLNCIQKYSIIFRFSLQICISYQSIQTVVLFGKKTEFSMRLCNSKLSGQKMTDTMVEIYIFPCMMLLC